MVPPRGRNDKANLRVPLFGRIDKGIWLDGGAVGLVAWRFEVGHAD